MILKGSYSILISQQMVHFRFRALFHEVKLTKSECAVRAFGYPLVFSKLCAGDSITVYPTDS